MPKITTEDVMVSGDLAVETGAFEFVGQPRTGAAVTEKGQDVSVWPLGARASAPRAEPDPRLPHPLDRHAQHRRLGDE